MAYHERTTDAARGKWKGILLQLGVPGASLTGKHGPCPLCQDGTDRFRFDNKDQRGTYICNTCGAGDGMKLATGFTGKSFTVLAPQIDAMLGNVKPDGPGRPTMSDDDRAKALRAVWTATKPVEPGDLAHAYLTSRAVGELIYPKALRFGVLTDGDGGMRPTLVAIVADQEGKPVTLHRTFLRPDGKAKAEMSSPRKIMPGELPDRCAVRLSEFHGGALGIAEGIETAMSASALYEMPVWAAINATMLAKWWPPEGCDEVAIFADNDAKFGGQAAAYALAHKLAVKGIAVTVHMPEAVGSDFNDVWLQGRGRRFVTENSHLESTTP